MASMKIPAAESVEVPREKIVDYLLSETHPVGRHKAVAFRSWGFAADRWQELAESLRRHAAENDVTKEEQSPFGTRFVVEGIMESADGRSPQVRSVWFLRNEETVPQFVTAYPLKTRSQGSPK